VAVAFVIETRGLSKRFGERAAVASVDLEIPSGVAFGFLGPNGAGKTTTIRMLLGLTRPSAGEARVLGHAMPREHKQALARVGAIVEEPRFHDHLTGRENLSIVSAAREQESAARIPEALARVGLVHRSDERVKSYSLGMRQRLGIARCLLADPQLLILDEPMNGLDPAGIQEVRGLIRSLVEEGRTVFLSSHLLDEVEKTCDQVAIIDRGTIIVQGKTEEIAQGGEQGYLLDVSDTERALEFVSQQQLADEARVVDGLLQLSLADGVSSGTLNRRLVEAGLDVSRLELQRSTLEERFLEITSRLEENE
jgi:ABC-2 type transport system ATP-binding protein